VRWPTELSSPIRTRSSTTQSAPIRDPFVDHDLVGKQAVRTHRHRFTDHRRARLLLPGPQPGRLSNSPGRRARHDATVVDVNGRVP
jgi:hypothetical protein